MHRVLHAACCALRENPFTLDSPRPMVSLEDYAYNELRYSILARANPGEAERLMTLAQEALNQKWAVYEEMATRGAGLFHPDARRVKD